METPLEDADVDCFEREETYYDSYNNNITFKTPIPEADPEEIKNNAKNVDDLATSENEILNIEEQVCEKIEQESVNEAIAPTNETIERTAALDQTTDMDKEPKEPNSPIQSFNEISQKVKNRVLNKEFLDLYLNDGYDRQISNCQLVDNRVSPIIDTRVKSNYCFKTDDFLEFTAVNLMIFIKTLIIEMVIFYILIVFAIIFFLPVLPALVFVFMAIISIDDI